ncbi:GNAT family N-acetyltransferase [Streptomyces kunmingensis]|uniref:GNAT family N-acetyltransferase n=1 Tax=Streptomyces kunmingensis TaxID=68225 RepID=A0ABU6C9S7_9ACTN|nr:GNAT family N-acetyltransferase [Streptomyces kunmingensis]MEB3961377.1 GNAT family N-acetyltransferase [Streptomyces kunmingensis]
MNDAVRVRLIADRDWTAITALEARAYSRLGLTEGQAALRAWRDTSPDTCFALYAGRQLGGYVLALPYPHGAYPDLRRARSAAGRTAVPTRNLHLHDLVIAPELRRRGLARHLLRHLCAAARSRAYDRVSLVSVGGTEAFWSARGFTPHPGVVAPGGEYGANAVYMSLSLKTSAVEVSGVGVSGAEVSGARVPCL